MIVVQQSQFDATRAPAGKHTGYAYCHVPAGSTVDLTDAIERQMERFAPGFRDRILARHTMNTAAFEQHNANMIGGDIGGGELHEGPGHQRARIVEPPLVGDLVGDLHDRLATLVEHLARVGKALEHSVEGYNRAVNSLESRLLPSARRFSEFGVGGAKEIPLLDPIVHRPRPLSGDAGETAS